MGREERFQNHLSKEATSSILGDVICVKFIGLLLYVLESILYVLVSSLYQIHFL